MQAQQTQARTTSLDMQAQSASASVSREVVSGSMPSAVVARELQFEELQASQLQRAIRTAALATAGEIQEYQNVVNRGGASLNLNDIPIYPCQTLSTTPRDLIFNTKVNEALELSVAA